MVTFKNSVWAVDENGLHTVGDFPRYEIPSEEIFKITDRGGTKYYDWPVHMAEKTWVDPVLLNSAFDAAIKHFSKSSGKSIDTKMLNASYSEAIRIG